MHIIIELQARNFINFDSEEELLFIAKQFDMNDEKYSEFYSKYVPF